MNLDKMWNRLAQHQPYADKRGYGPAWAAMCAERTADAARAADAATMAAAMAAMAADAGECSKMRMAAAAARRVADAVEAPQAAVRRIDFSEEEK